MIAQFITGAFAKLTFPTNLQLSAFLRTQEGLAYTMVLKIFTFYCLFICAFHLLKVYSNTAIRLWTHKIVTDSKPPIK